MLDISIPSNKTFFGNLKSKNKPTLELRLDKISITYASHNEDEKTNIASWLMDAKKYPIGKFAKSSSSNKRFKINSILYMENGSSCLLQANPKKSSDPFFRLECNPAMLGYAGISEVKFLCDQLFLHGVNIRPALSWKVGERLKREGIDADFDAIGVEPENIPEILTAAEASLTVLNEIRVEIFGEVFPDCAV